MEVLNKAVGISKADLEQDRLDKVAKRRNFLVKGIWLYFWLLILEGALRKWVLPSLSEPLLIVRDPVAIILLIYAWYYNMFPKSKYIVWMYIITFISIFTTLLIGHGSIAVTIYGARIFLIHFPFIFLIGSLLHREDVLKIGRVVLWISIPMAVLITLQFYSPQSAWVNRGVGGDMSGAGFGGAMGYFRPPGTFSFTNSLVAFFSLSAAFVLYFWLRPGKILKPILVCATIGLILAIPFSISRTLTFTILVMVVFVLVTLTRNPKFFSKVLVGILGIGIIGSLFYQTGFLDTPIEVFTARFESANKTEGGLDGVLGDRYIGGLVAAIVNATERPFFGEGLGMGTNAGSVLMGTDKRTFLIAEGEWQRIVGEMGALLGIAVIVIRLLITAEYALKSYLKIRSGDVLPWMMLSFAVLLFPQGNWAQPSMLGFSIFIMGLLIASFNTPEPIKLKTSTHTNQG